MFLLATVWRNKQQQKKYFNGRSDDIKSFEIKTKKSEFGHLIPFVIITILCVYFFITNFKKLAIITFFINCIFNWYPVILQRYHRMRLIRLEALLKKRKQNN